MVAQPRLERYSCYWGDGKMWGNFDLYLTHIYTANIRGWVAIYYVGRLSSSTVVGPVFNPMPVLAIHPVRVGSIAGITVALYPRDMWLAFGDGHGEWHVVEMGYSAKPARVEDTMVDLFLDDYVVTRALVSEYRIAGGERMKGYEFLKDVVKRLKGWPELEKARALEGIE
ncbi:MAG: hypothetical protein QXI60_08140, partial [Thermofilaceae archaeon]